MTKIIKKIKKMGGLVPYEAKGFRSGFVLLFAVTLSSILLAIALGVTNIAFKEAKFSTNAKDTNNAFFAADTGAECALLYDRNPPNRAFTDSPIPMTCAGNSSISVTPSGSPTNFWSFTISGLGSEKQGCAKVTVDKTPLNDPKTIITSNGYNNNVSGTCSTPGSNTVERQIEVKY